MKYGMVKVSDNMKNSCSRVLDRFWHVIIESSKAVQQMKRVMHSLETLTS